VASEHTPEEHEQVVLQVTISEAQKAGVWANFARVNHSEHEFTLDFVRIDYGSAQEGVVEGIVVARVGVSPLFVRQLIAALEDNWAKYAKKALPKEVYGDENATESGS
jgi:hypothetical protein